MLSYNYWGGKNKYLFPDIYFWVHFFIIIIYAYILLGSQIPKNSNNHLS